MASKLSALIKSSRLHHVNKLDRSSENVVYLHYSQCVNISGKLYGALCDKRIVMFLYSPPILQITACEEQVLVPI
ncbi:MAG: hypothetical protein ACJAVI_006248 [Candidatus Azotimanducaceae bacterium]|jgi:hypothetical protein